MKKNRQNTFSLYNCCKRTTFLTSLKWTPFSRCNLLCVILLFMSWLYVKRTLCSNRPEMNTALHVVIQLVRWENRHTYTLHPSPLAFQSALCPCTTDIPSLLVVWTKKDHVGWWKELRSSFFQEKSKTRSRIWQQWLCVVRRKRVCSHHRASVSLLILASSLFIKSKRSNVGGP